MNKSAIGKILLQFNAFAPFRFFNRDKLLVLVYHRFSNGEEIGKTSATVFRRHLDYLVRHYRVVSLTEAVSRVSALQKLSGREAVITIDDGYHDFYDIAFPILREYNVPATVYAVTGFVEGHCWIWTDIARYVSLSASNADLEIEINGTMVKRSLNGPGSRLAAAGAVNQVLKKLSDQEKDRELERFAQIMKVEVPDRPPPEFGSFTWDQAREMASAGIEIGSHTVSHPILTNVDAERLTSELEDSKIIIQREIGTNTVHFCYPNGDYAERERNAVEQAGYASAVSTEIRLCSDSADRFQIPRIDAEPEMYRFVQATSGFDRLKTAIRG